MLPKQPETAAQWAKSAAVKISNGPGPTVEKTYFGPTEGQTALSTAALPLAILRAGSLVPSGAGHGACMQLNLGIDHTLLLFTVRRAWGPYPFSDFGLICVSFWLAVFEPF